MGILNVESEAIKVLAESLVKAYGNVVAQNNKTYVNNQIKNYPGGSGIGGGGGSYSGAINISQIRGFANGVVNAMAAEFETATIGTAVIDNLFAQYGEFTRLVAEKAHIGTVDTEEIYADIAEIGISNIGQAKIDVAQIRIGSTDTAFVRQGISGQSYIDTLAVTDANIVSLSVGQIMLNDKDGRLVQLIVDQEGHVVGEPVTYDGDTIINNSSLDGSKIIDNSMDGAKVIEGTVSGSKLIANTISTRELNASSIFAKDAVVMDLIADNIEATRLFANEGFIPQLTTTIIQSQAIGEGLDITKNSSIELTNERIGLVISDESTTAELVLTENMLNAISDRILFEVDNLDLNNNMSLRSIIDQKADEILLRVEGQETTYSQTETPETDDEGAIWFNPSTGIYSKAIINEDVNCPEFAYDDDGNLLYRFNEEAEVAYEMKLGTRIYVFVPPTYDMDDNIVNPGYSYSYISFFDSQDSYDEDKADLYVEENDAYADHKIVNDKFVSWLIKEFADIQSELKMGLHAITSLVLDKDTGLTAVKQTADKIEWIVESGTSASNMTLTSDALRVITGGIEVFVNEVAINTLNTLVRVDNDGLHVGEQDSNKELLLDEESLNVRIGSETYSRFASNYMQIGNYRLYKTNDGGLAFKVVV